VIDRIVSIAAGTIILAGVAHVTVQNTGGYDTPHAALTWAVALGVACGSVFTGMALSAKQYIIATGLIVSIVAGEAYNSLLTGDRLIAGMEKAQAPTREHAKAYASAAAEVERLKALVASPPETSKRLDDAQAAKIKADEEAAETSAGRYCRTNCGQILLNTADRADAEVKAARAALDASNARTKADLATAQKRLATMKPPVSATPLADTLGISPHVFMMLLAGLGTLGINGLASFLLIYGTHRRQGEPEPRPLDRAFARREPGADRLPEPPRPQLATASPKPPAGSVPKILTAILEPADGQRVEAEECHGGYAAQCKADGKRALTPVEFVDPLREYCKRVGIRTKTSGRRFYLLDVRLAACVTLSTSDGQK
jgi:hypothetical protein